MNRVPSGVEPLTDEQLLADYSAGKESGLAGLVERYSRDIFVFVGRFTRNPAAAEDVVQETFIQISQSASSFDPSRRFRPWLYTIAANKARDHLRSVGRKRELPLGVSSLSDEMASVSYLDFLSDECPTPSECLEENERRDLVRVIISEMPEHLREILLLGYFEQLPYKEIATALGVPLGTVKSRLHAAVSHFAKAYKRMETSPSENSVEG